MEVRIKEGNGYVDAEWTIENGVMVVSPKKVKFVPKDGDIIVSGGDARFVAIFKRMKEEYSFYYYALLALSGDKRPQINNWDSFLNVRPVTEEEKQKLFDKLADEGLAWDAERKELVKIKWKPVVGQHFYFVEYDNENFIFIAKAYTYAFEDQIERDKTIAKGWCFKTSKECQEFCNRLNEAINQVKP